MFEELLLAFIAKHYHDAAHSVFAPSGSAMWMTCQGSLIPNLIAIDNAGFDAAQGTVAHSIHEEWLKTGEKPIQMIGELHIVDGHEIEIDLDMMNYVQESVDRLIYEPGTQHIEQRVFFSRLTPIPNQGGTADWYTLMKHRMKIRDYKHGKGVQVYAENNSQAMLYALGVFYKWDWLYDFQEIDIGIHQPRLDHFDYWTCDRSTLMRFAAKVKKAAKAAWRLNAPLTPSDKGCRFCKVKASCPAFLKMADDITDQVFAGKYKVTSEQLEAPLETMRAGLFEPDLKLPELLDTNDMARLLPFRGTFENWFSAMELELERRALDGKPILAHKLVESRSSREFISEKDAIAKMEAMGIPWPLLYSVKFISPAQAEDMLRLAGMRKGQAAEYLSSVVRKLPGKPVLVSENDKRPPYTSPDEGVFDDL